MSLRPPLSIPLQEELINDCRSVLRKLNSVAAGSSFHIMDSKLMMLKLRRARLGAQLAYSQHQSLLAEMELQLAETELKHELNRRRQFVTRSRTIRQTMKPPTNVTSKEIQTTQIYEDAVIDNKNTVDRSTQVDRDIGDADETQQIPERKIKVAKRKSRSSSKQNQRSHKDSLSKERTKTSRVGINETLDKDRERATKSRKETENSNPSKKQKTDAESRSADKGEKTKKDCREKHSEKRDSKKSEKSKTEKNKKINTSNDIQELTNDRSKNRDSETNVKHAKNRHDPKVKKLTKSNLKNPTDKEISKTVNSTVRDQASNETTSKGFTQPNLPCVEKTQTTEKNNNISEASEKNSDKNIDSTAAYEAVEPSNSKCDIVSSSCIKTGFTVVLEVADRKMTHEIQEMFEVPKKDLYDNIFEELKVMKRERSHSISSLETLKLQDESM